VGSRARALRPSPAFGPYPLRKPSLQPTTSCGPRAEEREPILNPASAGGVAEAQAVTSVGESIPERIPLGQLLVRSGFITEAQLDTALYEGSQTGERLGEVVVRHRWATDDDVAKLLAEQWGLSYVDRASIYFDGAALSRLPREDAQRLEALPTRVQDGRVVVAVAEPTEQRLAALRQVIGDDTIVIVVPKSALEAGLHSELLGSRGRSAGASSSEQRRQSGDEEIESFRVERAPPPERTLLSPAPVRAVEREPPKPVAAPVSAIRSLAPPTPAAASPATTTEGVAALAAQVRGVADSIAALAEYEQKVAQLESEVDARRRTMAEIKGHLEQVIRLIEESF
jgi:hypothetical protein